MLHLSAVTLGGGILPGTIISSTIAGSEQEPVSTSIMSEYKPGHILFIARPLNSYFWLHVRLVAVILLEEGSSRRSKFTKGVFSVFISI